MKVWWLLGAVLLVEGLMPLLFTRAWRQTFEKVLQLQDGQIRFIAFLSVMAGALLLLLTR
ncbi:MAG TPA: DUF2065 domain-containing protein [Methylophilus sp.]